MSRIRSRMFRTTTLIGERYRDCIARERNLMQEVLRLARAVNPLASSRTLCLAYAGVPISVLTSGPPSISSRNQRSGEYIPTGDARAGLMLAGFFRRDDKHRDAISDRLKALAGQARNPDAERDESESEQTHEVAPPVRRTMAALLFVAGPRAGERVVLEQGSVAFDRDGRALSDGSAGGVVMSVWPQGERYMLRDNAGVVVSGIRPAIPVVTLDDGDEISWGPHRLRFELLRPENQPPAIAE